MRFGEICKVYAIKSISVSSAILVVLNLAR